METLIYTVYNAQNRTACWQYNQNIGYPGAENNQPPLILPKEGTVNGPQQ
ncbi:MAG: hypothetical protein LBL33_04620 [Tannerella sp.]|jgi:hypothetical protein|nr:hypothetical protein [Tannerella sp.]